MIDPLDRTLALTRTELSPSGADKARLRAALGLPAVAAPEPARIEPDAPPRATTAAAPSPLTELAGLRASGKLGATLAAVLFGTGLVTGWALSSSTPSAVEAAPVSVLLPAPTPISAVAPEPVATDNTDDAEPLAVREAASPSRHSEQGRVRPRAPLAPPRSTSKPLDAELALLRRVERALRNGDPSFALALLSELDERFPQTRLGEERLAARTLAECRLDQPAASERARAFLLQHPASVYSERVQSACALQTTRAAPTR